MEAESDSESESDGQPDNSQAQSDGQPDNSQPDSDAHPDDSQPESDAQPDDSQAHQSDHSTDNKKDKALEDEDVHATFHKLVQDVDINNLMKSVGIEPRMTLYLHPNVTRLYSKN